MVVTNCIFSRLFSMRKGQNDFPLSIASGNALHIYEICVISLNQGRREFVRSISSIKEKLGIYEKYPKSANFKKKVLEPSKKQINERTDIEIDYEMVKEGRSLY